MQIMSQQMFNFQLFSCIIFKTLFGSILPFFSSPYFYIKEEYLRGTKAVFGFSAHPFLVFYFLSEVRTFCTEHKNQLLSVLQNKLLFQMVSEEKLTFMGMYLY